MPDYGNRNWPFWGHIVLQWYRYIRNGYHTQRCQDFQKLFSDQRSSKGIEICPFCWWGGRYGHITGEDWEDYCIGEEIFPEDNSRNEEDPKGELPRVTGEGNRSREG